MSTWTCEYCKSFLNSYKDLLQVNKNEFIDRCVWLKHLIANGLENMMSLSKTELKSMSPALMLPYGQDLSKDDMIMNVLNLMLWAHGDTSNGVLAVIDEEERNADVF